MDKESIQEYIDEHQDELTEKYLSENENIKEMFYEFAENEAINYFASKIDEAKERE